MLDKWRPKQIDPFRELLESDSPFFGLPLMRMADKTWGANNSWFPAVDVKEEKNNLIVKTDIPGLKKEEIDISIDGSVLTIKGERKSEKEDKDKTFYRVERFYGSFQRSIDLGTSLDANKIKAKYENGVLEITVPKSEHEVTKKINIEG